MPLPRSSTSSRAKPAPACVAPSSRSLPQKARYGWCAFPRCAGPSVSSRRGLRGRAVCRQGRQERAHASCGCTRSIARRAAACGRRRARSRALGAPARAQTRRSPTRRRRLLRVRITARVSVVTPTRCSTSGSGGACSTDLARTDRSRRRSREAASLLPARSAPHFRSSVTSPSGASESSERPAREKKRAASWQRRQRRPSGSCGRRFRFGESQ